MILELNLPEWLHLRSITFFETQIHVRAFLRDDYGYLVSAFGAGKDMNEATAALINDGIRLRPRPERKPFRNFKLPTALEPIELDL